MEKKVFDFNLRVIVEEDRVTVELDNISDDLPVMPIYAGGTSASIAIDDDSVYTSDTTWHGSEEMWYTTYKE